MLTCEQHPVLGSVVCSRTARARRITLTVKPSGEVRLSFPPSVSQRRAMQFLDERVEWVLQARERMARRLKEHPAQELDKQDIERLYLKARLILPHRVESLAQQYGFRYGRITIRASRTKWGCCTAQNNLSLSLFLVTLPPHLQDFVLLHELCHTVHHNHSPRFHALLDQLLGGRERELARELKQYSIQ